MCLFLEILCVKKCHNLKGGEIFLCCSEYFLHAKNMELLFLRSLV